MPTFVIDAYNAAQNPESNFSAIALIWTILGAALLLLIWPRGRTRARQLYALAALGFREGLRLKVLWTVLAIALVPGAIAFFSDADGTHAGRARLILGTCITSGELLGASLIVLLSALSVAREIESRIMHTIGAKPVPRWTILAGKALGFWAIDICFLLILTFYCAALVRAVPLRAEIRTQSNLEVSGSWDDLRRNALTTRIYNDSTVTSKSDFRIIRPGMKSEFLFAAPTEGSEKLQRSLRFSIGSNNSFLPHIPDVHITAFVPGKAAFLDRTETIPQGRPFEFFLDPEKTPAGEIRVTLGASPHAPNSKFPPISLIVARSSGVRMGFAADSFSVNLAKSFFMMAVQGWILALVTVSWSGVLSFPVTVALGVILILSGEMSRHVIGLLQSDSARLHEAGLLETGANSLQTQTIERLLIVLGLFPDFQAAGGPTAFVEGKFVSTLALAHAALWMGLLRGIGWALPGIIAFQKREVGK